MAIGDVVQVRDTVTDILRKRPQRAELPTIVLRYGRKGPATGDTVTVLDPLASTDCSAWLAHDMRVLAFVLAWKDRLVAYPCTPNGPVAWHAAHETAANRSRKALRHDWRAR